jgi:predicted TIM-barrel fold metal-dependent hydrolase
MRGDAMDAESAIHPSVTYNATQVRAQVTHPVVDCHLHAWDGVHGIISGWRVEDGPFGTWRLTPAPGASDQPYFPDYAGGSGEGDEIVLRGVPPYIPQRDMGPLVVEMMDWVGVTRGILNNGMSYTWPGDRQAEYHAKLVKEYPGRFVGLALFDPNREGALDYLDRLVDMGLKGVEWYLCSTEGLLQPGFYPGMKINDRRYDPLWEKVTDLGMLNIWDPGTPGEPGYQVEEWEDVLDRYDLRLIVNHMADIGRGREDLLHIDDAMKAEGTWDLWLRAVRMARRENVYFGIGGRSMKFRRNDRYPFPIYAKYFDLLKIVVEEIGVDKVVTGSDAPSTLRDSTYRQVMIDDVLNIPFLSEGEKAQILGINAEQMLTDWGCVK